MENKKVVKKSTAGRKSKYHTHIEPHLEVIRKLRRDGQTEEQIAGQFKVAYSTWRTYKSLFPAFAAALQEEGQYVLAKTEKSLYNTAWGYTQKQVKEIYELQYDPISKQKCMVLVKKEIMPDKIILGNVNAQKFLLTNLAPDKWVDKRDYNVNTESVVDKAIDNFKLVSDELAKNSKDNKDG